MRGVAQGEEPDATLYWRERRLDEPRYHVDYVFAPSLWAMRLNRVEIGRYVDWVGNGLSDHAPVIVDFAD